MLQKDDYFEVFCKYEGCPYNIRYLYNNDGLNSFANKSSQQTEDYSDTGSVFNFNNYASMKEKMKYEISHSKTINGNHSMRAHRNPKVKALDSIVDVK